MLRLWHHRRVLHESLVYEERYHWTRTSNTALIGCGIFVLFAVLLPMPLPLRVAIAALAGCGAFFSVIVAASRRVALRVDASGITLGGSPLRYKATTRVVPWHEVQGVFLWQRANGVRYLGVERPAEAPPLSPGGTGRADRTALCLSPDPQVPALTLTGGTTRGMQAFSVDEARLSQAIAFYAPVVDVVDLG